MLPKGKTPQKKICYQAKKMDGKYRRTTALRPTPRSKAALRMKVISGAAYLGRSLQNGI